MKKIKYFLEANAMLLSIIAANLMGMVMVRVLLHMTDPDDVPINLEYLIRAFRLAPVLLYFTITLFILWYEKPIRAILKARYRGESSPESLLSKSRRRLQNEPYVAMLICFVVWTMASIFFGFILKQAGAMEMRIKMTSARSFITGLFSMAMVFYLLEHVIQKHLAPIFFPHGQLAATKGTIKGRIGVKLIALVLSSGILPFGAILLTIRGSSKVVEQGLRSPQEMLLRLQSYLAVETLIFILLATGFTVLFATNLTKSIQDILVTLRRVRKGDFSGQVKVTSNDEIGYTGDAINSMIKGLQERDAIKELFGRYVTNEIRDEILAGRIKLGGELKKVTLLFSDLRDFTPMVEAHSPEVVVGIINGYFHQMAEAVTEHKGLVLQYVGDEIEAVFGAPLPLANHADQAVAAALSMRKRLAQYDQTLIAKGLPALRHGIGIHTGLALAANIGSPDRLSYALVGDTVNLASRISDLTKKFGTDILISADTQRELSQKPNLRSLPVVQVKGKSQAVEVFALE